MLKKKKRDVHPFLLVLNTLTRERGDETKEQRREKERKREREPGLQSAGEFRGRV